MTNSVEKAIFVDFASEDFFLAASLMAPRWPFEGRGCVRWCVRHAAGKFGRRVFGVRWSDSDEYALRIVSEDAERVSSSSSSLASAN